jgi:hypothetical protein
MLLVGAKTCGNLCHREDYVRQILYVGSNVARAK